MKIRTDFVTNSSSVSYIVSWSPDMAEFIYLKTGKYDNDPKKNRIYNTITKDLLKSGDKISIGENVIFVKKYGFMKKEECLYDITLGTPAESTDFETMDEQKLWQYICGEYLVNARLAKEFKGFGTVQVPRNVDKFKDKFCGIITCDRCPKKSTSACFKVQ